MSDNQLIYQIRQDAHLSRLFDELSMSQRRKALEIAEGDNWRLDEILEDVKEEEE